MGLRNSFLALLGRDQSDTSDEVIEHIRLAMLSAIDVHCDTPSLRVYQPIRRAQDISALWYLRPHLMQVIATSRSEAVARAVLQQITDLFKGHMASANASRFGSL
jgi:hypothetical protein